jgi:dTDP-glucose 4,6-dehydratase/UDP-glucose 4-epimerase
VPGVSLYNNRIAILRPFSVYGTGLKKQLFWDVYHKLSGQQPFQLFGTGNETRDFIHIDDMVAAIDLVVQHGKFEGEVYNVANGEAIKIAEIISEFADLSGIKTPYTFNNYTKAGDPIYWQADISRLNALGYKRKVSQKDGLKSYLQWVKENG